MTDTPVSPEQIKAIRERFEGQLIYPGFDHKIRAIATLLQALEERDRKIKLLEELTRKQAQALQSAEHNSEVRRRRVVELEGQLVRVLKSARARAESFG